MRSRSAAGRRNTSRPLPVSTAKARQAATSCDHWPRGRGAGPRALTRPGQCNDVILCRCDGIGQRRYNCDAIAPMKSERGKTYCTENELDWVLSRGQVEGEIEKGSENHCGIGSASAAASVAVGLQGSRRRTMGGNAETISRATGREKGEGDC